MNTTANEQQKAFYATDWDTALRFGDVVGGFVLSAPNFEKPGVQERFRLDVSLPKFAAVLSPCCSIGNKTVTLCPLIQVKRDFFENPFFTEDLTRINRIMDPKVAVPPDVWNNFPQEEQLKRIGQGVSYALVDHFIYEQHDLLTRYQLRSKGGTEFSTGYYMIDFRDMYKVGCNSINSAAQAPTESRILQLTVHSRRDLREKLSSYFGRLAPEDRPILS